MPGQFRVISPPSARPAEVVEAEGTQNAARPVCSAPVTRDDPSGKDVCFTTLPFSPVLLCPRRTRPTFTGLDQFLAPVVGRRAISGRPIAVGRAPKYTVAVRGDADRGGPQVAGR